MDKITIRQQPGERTCEWHQSTEGKLFTHVEIFPNGICPLLYHSVYPYFLGLLYGAKFSWNDFGDCNVCCPAPNGVDVLVCKRKNDGSFDHRIGKDMDYVIFAEITNIHDTCPKGHEVGQRFVFPSCMKEHYLCPAGFNNVFPLMEYEIPDCINKDHVRCPDWNNVIEYSIK